VSVVGYRSSEKQSLKFYSIENKIGEIKMSTLPLIAVTMGDPAGIGPEIALKALTDTGLYEISRPFILGDPNALSQGAFPPASLNIREISTTKSAGKQPGQIDLLPVSRLDPVLLRPGRPSLEGGKAMVSAIKQAVNLAQNGEIDGVVTGPISKVLMQRAGFSYEGHTELLADLTGAKDYGMMLAGEKLRVVLVTIHCALSQVPNLLTPDGIYRTLSLANTGLRSDFGIEKPAIAVAALNPHAGEEGLFGEEEKHIIAPAIARARADGIDAIGPLPADTVFHKAVSGAFDAVVCMYHDQGLIPLKLLHFSDGINVTLGLPIVRTSVDHGTAYDIAGKGIADPSSLKAAIRAAAGISTNRKRSVRSEPT
jgi:4-hydroxythreonine-4-phosphate dehydrogenase